MERGREPAWNPRLLDYSDPNTYLFPPHDIPVQIRKHILTAIANYYRWARGYSYSIRTKLYEDTTEGSSETTTTSGETGRSGIG